MERIICLVIGYVCGLFQTGYIIGKVHKTDIRDHGSGNAGTNECLPDLWKESGSDHPAGRLPEVCTGYCDRENGLWKFHEWYPSASYPLCSIGMYPRPQFSDFYGISRWKGNCCFCRHDHCF